MTIHYDISRCAGTAAQICEHCRRREPGDLYQWCIATAVTLDGCQNHIAPLPTTASGAATTEEK